MKKKIMIVDDDPYIRIAVRELLEQEGFDMHEADGGKECLRELQHGFKGMILMDIMMPGMDGWDTIREIANQGFLEGNLVLMLTARDYPDTKMEGLQEYVIDYITKPFEPEDFVSTIEGYLEYV